MLRSLTFAVCLSLLVTGLFVGVFSAPSGSAESEKVITRDTFKTDEKVVALTFDVTFDRGDGAEVLDTLRRYGVSSTWAITGVWAENNPDLMRRIVDEGHHLINHTWHHFSFTGEYTGSSIHEPAEPLSRDEIIEQLVRTDELVMSQVGVSTRPYIRPPYGDYDDATLEAFAEAGFTENIMWTVDTYGWYGHDVSDVTQRALDAAEPGANILMHIGHGSTDGMALRKIIEGFRDLGYEFATVEDFVEGQYADPTSRFRAETGSELSDSLGQMRARIEAHVWDFMTSVISGSEVRDDAAAGVWTNGSRFR